MRMNKVYPVKTVDRVAAELGKIVDRLAAISGLLDGAYRSKKTGAKPVQVQFWANVGGGDIRRSASQNALCERFLSVFSVTGSSCDRY